MPSAMAIETPAKVNLALAVGPPSADGMHPICSWMITVDLYDDLLVTRLPDDRLSRYAVLWHDEARRASDIDWSITSDLAVRAHLALERHVGRRLPVQMKLEKRIPVGAGLGGGSSNAAGMLVVTDELFGLGLSVSDLEGIGASLGADVPFFVRGGSAIVEGFGERVVPHDQAPDVHLVLVLPEFACATGQIYAKFDELAPGPMQHDAIHALVAADPSALFNDLTGAAVAVAPMLKDLMRQVSELAGRPAFLCGSGSSLFVPCDEPLHAEHLAAALEDACGLPALAVRATAAGRKGVRNLFSEKGS